MIALQEARSYVAKHVALGYDVHLFDNFLSRFQAGGYVVLNNDQPQGSAGFFARSKHLISHLFVYRLTNAKTSGVSVSFVCFDGQPCGMYDYAVLLNHCLSYITASGNDELQQKFNPMEIASRGLPIDGAFLLGGNPADSMAELKRWHVTRSYISPADSRRLLAGAIHGALEKGFS